jgi:penicillin-binding protein 2
LSYPQKDSAERFFKKEYVGKGGVEKYLNEELNGILGKKKIEVDSYGRVISDNIISKSKPGKNITLSVDKKLQEKMAISLNTYIKKNSFKGGAAAIMNVENGEILAMVSLPEYSSSVLTEGKDRKKIKQFLNDSANPFLNKMVYGEFTPGSIVKPFVALMGLKNNVVTAKEKLYTNGSIVIANKYNPANPSIFRDWKNHGVVDLYKAMAQSSNVYFYTVGGGILNERKGLGIKKMEEEFLNFGFGQKTGVEFFAEKKGLVPNPE